MVDSIRMHVIVVENSIEQCCAAHIKELKKTTFLTTRTLTGNIDFMFLTNHSSVFLLHA